MIFRGNNVNQSQAFGQIQAYSPTGKFKMLPMTDYNIKRYAKYMSQKIENERKVKLNTRSGMRLINCKKPSSNNL